MDKEEIKSKAKKIWNFLKEDTWPSFFVDLVLAFIIIKFIFFPLLSFLTGAAMPLVIVESCSMYHSTNLEDVMRNPIYSNFNLTLQDAKSWRFKNGINKGDIIFVVRPNHLKIGDIIIFSSTSSNPIIHRVVSLTPLETKGDHNSAQLNANNNPGRVDETNIQQSQLVGKALFRIPYLGWVKLIFFEPFRQDSDKGFCR